MQSFGYVKATGTEKALAGFAVNARFIAGGTTLVDLMKLGVEKPSGLVDINLLPLDKIEDAADTNLAQKISQTSFRSSSDFSNTR